MARFSLILFGALLLCAVARSEDVITLNDGEVRKGKVLQEEKDTIYIAAPDGEITVIPKSNIKKMEIAGVAKIPEAKKPADNGAIEPKEPVIGQRETRKALDPEWAKPRIADLTGLGAPELAKRKVALETVKSKPDEYIPVMLAMLHPKQKTDEYTRIGILRALMEFAPLPDDAAQTLAYSACNDPYAEARREACRTIKYLQEDRALRELGRYAFQEGNAGLKQAAAIALHEIDDNRIYGQIVGGIPQPQVVANYGEGTGIEKPKYNIPAGPGGLRIPIWLPSQPVTGMASDIGGPLTDFLKLLARKDLGNLPYAWIIWYREKVGEIGKEDRDAYNEKRSLRGRSNAP